MSYAQVVLDIPSKILNSSFDYRIPEESAGMLDQEHATGSLVMVSFGPRKALGYVVSVSDTPSKLDSDKPVAYKSVEKVLQQGLFDDKGLALARWISSYYAAPLSECIRLLCPPGRRPHLVKQGGSWILDESRTQAKEVRVARITAAGREVLASAESDSKLFARAYRQKTVLDLLSKSELSFSELALTVPSVSTTLAALEKKGYVSVELRRRLRELEKSEGPNCASHVRRSFEELTSGQQEAYLAIEEARAKAADGLQIAGAVTQSKIAEDLQAQSRPQLEVQAGSRPCDRLHEKVQAVLLDGVTGSGKTEVYLQAIESCLAQGRDAIVLVPEISITPQTVGRFRSRFGDQVAVLHSRLSDGERYDQWDMVRLGKARLAIGPRSALFAPFKNLGLIIIDEEHDSSYKQGSTPRYHARELACKLAILHGAALVLGSATPCAETLYLTQRFESWRYVELPERTNKQARPQIQLVDMAQEFKQGNRSMFSEALKTALKESLEAGHKAMLLLNRRGFAHFYLCRDCGYIPRCEHCSSSLTYHSAGHKLMCHSCDKEYEVPTRCPACGSPYLKLYGAGTQRLEIELEALLKELMPTNYQDVALIRMDADSTSTKGAHQKLLERFDSAERAILFGTQMIAKGLDFPDLALVGILNADNSLNLPDFRAQERSYALLEQMAGRAGRAEIVGKVIVQTYQPQEPLFRDLVRYDSQAFREREFKAREAISYPPYTRLIRILCSAESKSVLEQTCTKLALELQEYLRAIHARGLEAVLLERTVDFLPASFLAPSALPVNPTPPTESLFSAPAAPVAPDATPSPPISLSANPPDLIGPSACVIERIQDKYRWHILLRLPLEFDHESFLLPVLESCARYKGRIQTVIDIDPLDLL